MRLVNNIKAVHDDDVDRLLQSLGVADEIDDGQIKCQFCSKAISRSNFAAIIPNNGGIAFCCDDPQCYQKFIERVQ